MKPHTCPNLGSRDDPKTALDFPSEGNCCYHARPVAPVNSAHQVNYCLTGEHVNCPIYVLQQRRPLPAAIAAPATRSQSVSRTLAFVFVPIALVAIALAATWIQRAVIASQLRVSSGASDVAPLGFPILDTGLFDQENRITNTPYRPVEQPSTVVLSPTPALAKDCPLPSGWVTYTMKPTDSLFRLSVLYGISVENLQQANCLTSQATIQPGNTIYVPVLPTPTPTITLTPTRAPVIVQPTQPPAENKPQPQPPQPQPPQPAPTATQSQPIAPPTQAPPPTEAPPTPAPTDPPLPPPVDTPTIAPASAIQLPTLEPTKEEKPTKEPKPTKDPAQDSVLITPTTTSVFFLPLSTLAATVYAPVEPTPTSTAPATRTPFVASTLLPPPIFTITPTFTALPTDPIAELTAVPSQTGDQTPTPLPTNAPTADRLRKQLTTF